MNNVADSNMALAAVINTAGMEDTLLKLFHAEVSCVVPSLLHKAITSKKQKAGMDLKAPAEAVSLIINSELPVSHITGQTAVSLLPLQQASILVQKHLWAGGKILYKGIKPESLYEYC